MVRSEGNEQNVESYVAIIVNIDGTEETEIYGDRKDHANTLSNWVTISKFLSFFLYSTILMTGKKEEVRAEVPITDLKEGEMVGKLHENRKTRNGRPSDQLIVKFIVTTFVQM